jgi:hypothetical protein
MRPLLIILCVIQLHSPIVLTYCDQNAGNYSQLVQPSSLSSYSANQGSVVCVSRFATGDKAHCLSVSYSFSMSSHLAAPVSHLLFIIPPHPILKACPVTLSTAEPCVKMRPENTEVKMSFIWLMSYVIFSVQSELHWWHKLITVYTVGYNVLVNYW